MVVLILNLCEWAHNPRSTNLRIYEHISELNEKLAGVKIPEHGVQEKGRMNADSCPHVNKGCVRVLRLHDANNSKAEIIPS